MCGCFETKYGNRKEEEVSIEREDSDGEDLLS